VEDQVKDKSLKKQDVMSINQRRHSEYVQRDLEYLESKVQKTDLRAEQHRRSVEQKERMIKEIA
jgi:ActR/RegA family two-component response regulator